MNTGLEISGIGNLAANPSIKENNGLKVCSFRIASNRAIKVGDNWGNVPCFVDVVCFGKLAERAAKSLKKGAGIFIRGFLDYSTWADPATKKQHSRHSIKLISFWLLNGAENKVSPPNQAFVAAPGDVPIAPFQPAPAKPLPLKPAPVKKAPDLRAPSKALPSQPATVPGARIGGKIHEEQFDFPNEDPAFQLSGASPREVSAHN